MSSLSTLAYSSAFRSLRAWKVSEQVTLGDFRLKTQNPQMKTPPAGKTRRYNCSRGLR